ncbi:recombinase family protein [Paenibacillus sp. GCM10012307]|uniref:Recombinase family protein n=1 Tax=Paenibacillus roseus TaxID=2798579 RepID=A0A934MPF2_9BACL|nr:recombinase family protein [Paenibacillus roseus]MBJ6360818.1 recombinase family protein [Paenibacillus roseus]
MRELVIVEEEAVLVREICHLYRVELWGTTKIAKHMNNHSTTKEGGKWDNKAVKNVLFNPTNAGFNHFKAEEWPEEQRIMVAGSHQGIITEEELFEIFSIRDRRKEGHMSRRSFEYPYAGLIKCGICGATYAGNASVHGTKKYLSYRCLSQYAKGTCDAPSISERILNQLVLKHIQLVEDGYQEPKHKPRRKVSLDKELAISQKRRHNWMMALGDGKLSGDDYATLIDGEDSRIAKIKKEAEPEPEQTIPIDEIRKAFVNLKSNWSILNASTQKQIIQSLFKKITIKKSDDWHIVDMLTV